MKIAIIGAGVSGLLSAYRLVPECEVTVFEKADQVGGLCKSIDCDGRKIDKYNHFFSRTDTEIINISRELGLGSKIYWVAAKQSFITKDAVVDICRPGDFFHLSGIGIYEKIRLLYFLLYNYLKKHGKTLNKYTAQELICKLAGKDVFEHFFKPFLKFKFNRFDDISAAYIWARLRENKKNVIGYLSGGMKVLLDRLLELIKNKGGRVLLNTEVKRVISAQGNKWKIITADQASFDFDRVILCAGGEKNKSLCEGFYDIIKKKFTIEYLSVSCSVLKLKTQLKPGYWLFTVDGQTRPLRVVVDTTPITGESFVYVPVYSPRTSTNEQDKEQVLNDCFDVLKKINPQFNSDWVEKSFVFTDEGVEPVITRSFVDGLLAVDEFEDGFYVLELLYEASLLKTLNTSAIKSKIIAEQITKNYVRNNSS